MQSYGMNLCQKCNYMHYATVPCIVGPRNPIPVQDAKVMTAKTARAVEPQPAQETQILRPGPVPEAAKFDKKAWQREYMREHRRGVRRRAAEKEAGK